MLFYEGRFLYLLAAMALAALLARSSRQRAIVLLVASYVFYGSWDWRFLFLVWGCTLADFHLAAWMPRVGPRARKRLLCGSLALNLGALAFFKYLDFGIASLNALFGFEIPLAHVLLPVGISFFTFQSMTYTIDIYRGKIAPHSSLVDFALFISFFPHNLTGPIIRASDFFPQVERALARFPHHLIEAVPLFCLGMFKKLAIADNLGRLVDPVYAMPVAHTGADVWLATVAFAGQIYADFSGYTDMALALFLAFGFRFPENFRSPFLATGMRDFWRRWNVSLSNWLRDYVYIPLSGGRRTGARAALAVMLTMLACGLWHGANVMMVSWGAYTGVLMLAEQGLNALAPGPLPRGLRALRPLAVFAIRLPGFAIFRAPSALALGDLLSRTTVAGSSPIASDAVFLGGMAFLLVEQGLGEWRRRRPGARPLPPALTFFVAGWLLLLALFLRPETSPPFIYFQF